MSYEEDEDTEKPEKADGDDDALEEDYDWQVFFNYFFFFFSLSF